MNMHDVSLLGKAVPSKYDASNHSVVWCSICLLCFPQSASTHQWTGPKVVRYVNVVQAAVREKSPSSVNALVLR